MTDRSDRGRGSGLFRGPKRTSLSRGGLIAATFATAALGALGFYLVLILGGQSAPPCGKGHQPPCPTTTATTETTTTTTTTTTTPGEPTAIAGLGYSLVWSDEFDTLSYNNSGSQDDAYTWQRPYNAPNAAANSVTASNGILKLTYAPSTAKAIEIGTKKSVGNYTNSWTYGYFETYAQLPDLIGAYPQFWLFGLFHGWNSGIYTDCSKLSPYTDTTNNMLLTPEIDVFEGGWEQGGWGVSGSQQYNTTTHSNTASPCGVTDSVATHFNTPAAGFFSGFHKYGMLWTPSTVSFWVDDVQTYSVAANATLDAPVYMILGLGHHATYPYPLPSSYDMLVDWVHVWQQ
jgi:beta-glucanase (GH16 family)